MAVVLTMFLGFAIEVLGVATGWLFGDYSYGSGLGPKALDVPLLMGVCGGCCCWARTIGQSDADHGWTDRVSVVRAAVAATLMTALDGAIEPVAIRAGWWTWHNGAIPWTNYATWWIAAFALGMLWKDVEDLKTNRLSGLLVLVFAGFFALLNFIPWTI